MYKNNHRIRIIFAFICLALFGIILYFIYFMVSKNDFYQSEYERLSNQYLYGWTAPRGRILDVNGNVLVDNEAVSVLAYSKSSSTTVTKEVELAKKINELIEVSGDDIDEEDMRSFYLLFHREELVAMAGEEVENQYKKREITLSEYNNILKSFISSEQLSNYNEDDKRVIQIYQWMNQSYSYDIKVIKRDLSTEELAALSEHMGELMGCFITYDWERVYFYGDTLKSIFGGVSSSTQGIPLDDIDYYSSDYSLNDRVGISGLEKQYDEVLKGEKAKYKINGNHSISLVSSAKRGNDIVLTIDIELQQAVDGILESEILRAKTEGNTEYYKGSYVVLSDPKTGGILAISGKNAVSNATGYSLIDASRNIFTSPMTPGSIVKGASMLVGYTAGAVQIGETIYDECIKIAGTPEKCSHAKLGRINDIEALAYSSNVYQFHIAMRVSGNQYYYGMPMHASLDDFETYRNVFRQFGLGVKTGVDFPVESVGNIGTGTSPGLLLDFAMGQYDTYTVMQMSQYITTIANDGVRIQPHFLKSVHESTDDGSLGPEISSVSRTELGTLPYDEAYLDRIQEGFQAVMSYGLGKGVMGTSPNPAGKTGTSETFLDTDGDGVIDTETISNAFVGYAPYDDPVMTIAVTSPDISHPSTTNSYFSYVNRRLSKQISSKFFELYGNPT